MVRLLFIDIAKGIAILSVLIGHFMQYTTDSGDISERSWLWELIYSFHMPLFMILSGYFTRFEIDFDKIKKRFMCLIMPGFIWSVIIGCVLYLLVTFAHFNNPIEDQTFLLRVFKQFWFLSCLFFCYLTGIGAVKLFRNEIVAFFVSTLLLMLFCVEEHLHINFLYPFLWVGYFLRKKNIVRRASWTTTLALLVLYVFLLILWSSQLTVYALPIKVFSVYENGLLFETENVLITIYRFFLGLVGSMFFIFLSYMMAMKYIDSNGRPGGIERSFHVYSVH